MRYMTETRFENGHFLYRDGDYPFGKEYILIPSGTNKEGERIFTEIEVWDGEIPYNERRYYKPVKDSIAPKGYVWCSNGKSYFGGERKTALLRIEKRR